MGVAKKLNGTLRAFIANQRLFFVATAARDGHVNVSPKGAETLRIVDNTRLQWLNLTGSGNETAAHVRATGRMTLMFCAFEGSPLILRTYGRARVFHPRDPEWAGMLSGFPNIAASRQIFDMQIDLVQTSCGSGVPEMKFEQDRADTMMTPYYEGLGEEGVQDYWRKKNMTTIDGAPTGIFDDV